MKMKKNVWKKILPALIAVVVMSSSGYAAPVDVDVPVTQTSDQFSSDIKTGAFVDGTNAYWNTTSVAISSGNPLNLNYGIALTDINGTTTYGAAAFGVNGISGSGGIADSTGYVFNLDNVVISGTTGSVGKGIFGVLYGDASSANPFAGIINAETIDVTNTSSDAHAYAFGVSFLNTNDDLGAGIGTAGSITTGDITATGSNAIGFTVGAVTAGNGEIGVGNVIATATGTNGEARGVQFRGAITNAENATISIGDIDVTSNGTGHAIGLGFWKDANASAITEIGEIKAHATGTGEAKGIDIGDEDISGGTLTVKNNITATSDEGDAYGIFFENNWFSDSLKVTLDNESDNLAIVADGKTRSYSVWLSTDNGSELTIENGTEFTNGGNAFTVFGANIVNFDVDTTLAEGSKFVNGYNSTEFVVAAGVTANVGLVDNTFDGTSSLFTATTTDAESALNIKTLLAADAAFNGLGQTTVNNGVVSGTATIGAAGTLNTTGNFSAGTVAGYGDNTGKFNVQSGTATVGQFADSGSSEIVSVDVDASAKLVITGIESEVQNLSGDGALYFTAESDDELLTVRGTNTFNGDVVSVDSLGFGVVNDAGSYKAVADGIAHIADGYLAIAAIHSFNTGSQAVQDHFISGNAKRRGFLGQSPCDEVESCNPCDSVGLFSGSLARSAWVNYVGRSNKYQSSYNGRDDWDIRSNGVQTGVDLYRTNKNQFGLLFGYEKSDADMRTNNIDAEDVYVGFYGAHVFNNGADARLIANFGWQDYDLSRSNYAGDTFYLSSFSGNTTEVNLELGKRFYRQNGLSFRPVVAFDVSVNDVDGTQEATEIANAASAVTYNGLSYTQAFLRFGSDFKVERKRASLSGGLYYAYDLNSNILHSTVTTSGNKVLDIYGSDLGRQVLTFNIGSSFKVNNRFDVFGGFTGNAYVDRDGTPFQSVGYVGGAVRW